MAQAEFSINIRLDAHSGVPPITRESFLAAYVDANPYKQCEYARCTWEVLHDRYVLSDEIDEDPS